MNERDKVLEKWNHLLPLVKSPTWTEGDCLCFCAEQASRANIGVEIGTYMGASAHMMLMASPSLQLWCVDKWETFGTRQVTEMYLRDFIAQGRCRLIVGDSSHAASALSVIHNLHDESLDFVWVDDGHTREDLQRDISCFWPKLRPGGTMFGHDYDGEVKQAVDDMFAGVVNVDSPVNRLWRAVKALK